MVDEVYKTDKITDWSFIRRFSSNVDADKLVWHRDKKDRKIVVISGSGWLFQHDNENPFELVLGLSFEIKAMSFHRLIKMDSCTDLCIKVEMRRD